MPAQTFHVNNELPEIFRANYELTAHLHGKKCKYFPGAPGSKQRIEADLNKRAPAALVAPVAHAATMKKPRNVIISSGFWIFFGKQTKALKLGCRPQPRESELRTKLGKAANLVASELPLEAGSYSGFARSLKASETSGFGVSVYSYGFCPTHCCVGSE